MGRVCGAPPTPTPTPRRTCKAFLFHDVLCRQHHASSRFARELHSNLKESVEREMWRPQWRDLVKRAHITEAKAPVTTLTLTTSAG